MAQAVLNAALVSHACQKALATHSLVDTNVTARRTVERLQALALAADATPDCSRCVTVTDEEFHLISAHWAPHPVSAHAAIHRAVPLRSFG